MTGTVLVTGGSGFLGSSVVPQLKSVGWEVVAPTRSELDLSDAVAVADVIEQRSVTAVVHLAACLDRRDEPKANDAQWRDTFTAGSNLLLTAARSGVRRCVAAGSMDEVGSVHGVVGPDTAAAPVNMYGLCKTLLLDVARFASSKYALNVEWFRPTTMYGPGQRGPMLVPSAFETAMSGRHADFTSGEQRRNFVYVDDVAAWVTLALGVALSDEGSVRVHHVGGEEAQVRHVLAGIADLTGANFNIGALPRRAGEPDLVTVPLPVEDRAPLSQWQPRVDLADGLYKTFEWWKSQ